MTSRLITIRRAARILGLSQNRVYELARQRRIPIVRLGRQIRVDTDALEEWIRAGGCGLSETANRQNDRA